MISCRSTLAADRFAREVRCGWGLGGCGRERSNSRVGEMSEFAVVMMRIRRSVSAVSAGQEGKNARQTAGMEDGVPSRGFSSGNGIWLRVWRRGRKRQETR